MTNRISPLTIYITKNNEASFVNLLRGHSSAVDSWPVLGFSRRMHLTLPADPARPCFSFAEPHLAMRRRQHNVQRMLYRCRGADAAWLRTGANTGHVARRHNPCGHGQNDGPPGQGHARRNEGECPAQCRQDPQRD